MTAQEILIQLFEKIPDKYDKSDGSFFYDALMPVAIEMEKILEKADSILRNAFAKTAEGEYLELKAAEQNIKRHPATAASGYVTVKGSQGAVIKQGDKVSSQTVTFSVVEGKTLLNGSADVYVVCDTLGSAGNMPVGSINKFPVTIPGLTSVTNTKPITGGYDAQTDDELRKVYFDKVSTPSTSGNIYDYLLWAKEVTGVGAVKVFPEWDGSGTVKVLIIDANGTVNDDKLINAVKADIEEKRPIGAKVTVEYAVPVMISISLKLVLKTGVGASEIKLKIEKVITEYLKEIAFNQSYISYAGVSGRILQLDEVSDCLSFLLNGSVDNIILTDTQVPLLETVVVTE